MYSMTLDDLSKRMDRELTDKVSSMRTYFTALDSRLQPSRALDDIGVLSDKVEASLDRIRSESMMHMKTSEQRLDSIEDRPDILIRGIMNSFDSRLESDVKHLEGVNPMNVLTRGYSMITTQDGTVLKSVSDISVGDRISIHLRDGSAEADVVDKEMKR